MERERQTAAFRPVRHPARPGAGGRYPEVEEVLEGLPEYAALVERMRRAAALERGGLARPAVAALYGQQVPMSASRMDKFKSCHFSYFMQYGLKAKARRTAGFQAPEYGTFVHYVLEHVLRTLTKDGAVPVPCEMEREELHALSRSVVERYVREELGGLERETPRFRYLFRRLLKSVYAVVENVAEELALRLPAHCLRAGLRRGEGPAAGRAEGGRPDREHLGLCGPGGRLGGRGEALSPGGGL